MKSTTIIAYLAAAGLAVLGIAMASTNPNQTQYEDYASERLSQYLKTDVCKKTQGILQNLINFNCEKTVDSFNPQMRGIIAGTTERQDFLLFSIYRTNLKLNSVIPSYSFQTVGAFNSFYTYSAQQQ
ncbi:DUF4359 domain-containing protein [Nostoc linckia FACHB-104]|nr:DUF4359 domain-containing protein [Nostoc linckia FACHB-104]